MSDDRAPKLQAKHWGAGETKILTIRYRCDAGPWAQTGVHEKYGQWWRYDVECEGEARAFFPFEYLNEEIVANCPDIGIGGKVGITKDETPDGKIVWSVDFMEEGKPPPERKDTGQAQARAQAGSSGGGWTERALNEAMSRSIQQVRKIRESYGEPEDPRGFAAVVNSLFIAYTRELAPKDFFYDDDIPF